MLYQVADPFVCPQNKVFEREYKPTNPLGEDVLSKNDTSLEGKGQGQDFVNDIKVKIITQNVNRIQTQHFCTLNQNNRALQN